MRTLCTRSGRQRGALEPLRGASSLFLRNTKCIWLCLYTPFEPSGTSRPSLQTCLASAVEMLSAQINDFTPRRFVWRHSPVCVNQGTQPVFLFGTGQEKKKCVGEMKTLNGRMTHERWRLEWRFDRRGATPQCLKLFSDRNELTGRALRQLSDASLVTGIGWAHCEKLALISLIPA